MAKKKAARKPVILSFDAAHAKKEILQAIETGQLNYDELGILIKALEKRLARAKARGEI